MTVFLYLLGFGVIIPIMPILSKNLGASAFETGALMSVYSLMQFLLSPYWGRLSDRVGRRPVLVYCLLGEFFCYILFAFSNSLEMLFLSRILAGVFGASISTASAYISDITSTSERSKGMALIGMAFGLGFVLGPAIGGSVAYIAANSTFFAGTEIQAIGIFVAVLCFGNFIFSYFKLPESIKEKNTKRLKANRFLLIWNRLLVPTVGSLIVMYFLASFAMSSMENSLVLYMNDRFQWGALESSFGFTYIGVMIVFTQGFLVRRLLPAFGEKKTLYLGLSLFSLGFLGIVLSTNITGMAVAMTLLSIGNGLCNPSILGCISLLTNNLEQGETLGITQSLSSLGRILGPAIGGFVYGHFSKTSPFAISFTLAVIALIILTIQFRKIPSMARSSK